MGRDRACTRLSEPVVKDVARRREPQERPRERQGEPDDEVRDKNLLDQRHAAHVPAEALVQRLLWHACLGEAKVLSHEFVVTLLEILVVADICEIPGVMYWRGVVELVRLLHPRVGHLLAERNCLNGGAHDACHLTA